jgi:hypothetical protein
VQPQNYYEYYNFILLLQKKNTEIQGVREVAVHLQKVSEVMSTSVATGNQIYVP